MVRISINPTFMIIFGALIMVSAVFFTILTSGNCDTISFICALGGYGLSLIGLVRLLNKYS